MASAGGHPEPIWGFPPMLPHLEGAAGCCELDFWVGTALVPEIRRVLLQWIFSTLALSPPEPRVPRVPADQAHQRRERLLQVRQVCEAGGNAARPSLPRAAAGAGGLSAFLRKAAFPRAELGQRLQGRMIKACVCRSFLDGRGAPRGGRCPRGGTSRLSCGSAPLPPPSGPPAEPVLAPPGPDAGRLVGQPSRRAPRAHADHAGAGARGGQAGERGSRRLSGVFQGKPLSLANSRVKMHPGLAKHILVEDADERCWGTRDVP